MQMQYAQVPPGFAECLLPCPRRAACIGKPGSPALCLVASLGPECIVPSVFDREVVPAVAEAVAGAARQAGIARQPRDSPASDRAYGGL
jgi:malic enzyme